MNTEKRECQTSKSGRNRKTEWQQHEEKQEIRYEK
jgi:hypothetical protein